jgi:F0F1-type ATP synthase assembly protein I
MLDLAKLGGNNSENKGLPSAFMISLIVGILIGVYMGMYMYMIASSLKPMGVVFNRDQQGNITSILYEQGV